MSLAGSAPPAPFLRLAPPYRELVPLLPADVLRWGGEGDGPPRGEALVWDLGAGGWGRCFDAVRSRPGGVALIAILPPSETEENLPRVLDVLERCRPAGILPHHPGPSAEELVTVLRSPPEDLHVRFGDYLHWRGIRVDPDTRRLVRKTVELSEELRSVTALSRSIYLSRRALGRRFLTRGLPVPSHLLQFARTLRASIRLQSSSDSLFAIACDLGYPDGFSLSNQMMRLIGVRPSDVRDRFGWEWIVELWLQREAEAGALPGWLESDRRSRERARIRPQRVAEPVSLARRTPAPARSGAPVLAIGRRSPVPDA